MLEINFSTELVFKEILANSLFSGWETSFLLEQVLKRFLGMDIWNTLVLAQSIERGSMFCYIAPSPPSSSIDLMLCAIQILSFTSRIMKVWSHGLFVLYLQAAEFCRISVASPGREVENWMYALSPCSTLALSLILFFKFLFSVVCRCSLLSHSWQNF